VTSTAWELNSKSLPLIFFSKESICATSLRQLLIVVGCNKKAFQEHIALDNFFIAKFLFAIDCRFQYWLSMCKLATVSCSQVDDRVLHFDLVINDILNSQFSKILPATFKKVNSNPNIVVTSKEDNSKIKGNKCRKKNQESRNVVKNTEHLKEFKMASGESWDKNFRSQCPKEHPNFSKDCKMCARWHIKGNCFDTCPCALSHVPGSKITPKQKKAFLGFMKKCWESPPVVEANKRDDSGRKRD
jgi:hypothetical protein